MSYKRFNSRQPLYDLTIDLLLFSYRYFQPIHLIAVLSNHNGTRNKGRHDGKQNPDSFNPVHVFYIFFLSIRRGGSRSGTGDRQSRR